MPHRMKKFPIRKKRAQQKQPRPLDDGSLDDKRGDEHQEIQNEQNFGHKREILDTKKRVFIDPVASR